MKVIELTGTETITAVHDLLSQCVQPGQGASAEEVLLYVPKGTEALENNRVNLALLRRWADNLSLRLALVIEHRETRGLAREVGLLVVHSVEQAKRHSLRYLDQRRRRQQGLPPRPISSILRSPPTRPNGAKAGRSSRRIAAALASAFLLLAILVGAMVLMIPSATVELAPVSEPVEATMQIRAVAGLSDVSYETGEIPARTISVERSGASNYPTTGRTEVPDGHAEGMVVFANKTTIGVTITKGTVVRTSTGDNVRFFTVADAWLPGTLYGSVRVGILAAEPGPRGNVAPLKINVVEGELAAQVDVLNDARTTGGSVRRMGVVDGADVAALRAKLMKQLQQEAYLEITAGLAQTEFVAPDSLAISVIDEQFDHKVGDLADELGLTMQVKVTGLAVDTAQGHALLLSLLAQRIKSGYGLVEGSTSYSSAEQVSADAEKASYNMTVRGIIAPAIDRDQTARLISGKTVTAAQDLLTGNLKLTGKPVIKLVNSLGGRLPLWSRRIRIIVSAREP